METVVSTPVWEVGYLDELNFSRTVGFDYLSNKTKIAEGVESFVNKGWLAEKPVHIFPVESAVGDFADKAGMARKARHDFWLEQETVSLKIHLDGNDEASKFDLSAVDLANAHKMTYLTEKGNDRKINWLGVSGHRRARMLIIANAILLRLKRPIITEMATIKSEYGHITDLQEACLWENLSQVQGVVTLGIPDKLTAARHMYQKGALEIRLRKVFKDGMGQKLYGLCWNDDHYGTDLVDRCIKDPKLFGPLTAADLRKFRNAYEEAESVVDNPDSSESDVEIMKAVMAPDALVQYFENPKAGKKNEPAMAKKDTITGIGQSPVKIIKAVVKAVLKDMPTTLDVYTPYAAEINTAIELIMAGATVDFDNEEMIITKIQN